MIRVLLEIVLCVTFLISARYFAPSSLQPDLYGMSIGVNLQHKVD